MFSGLDAGRSLQTGGALMRTLLANCLYILLCIEASFAAQNFTQNLWPHMGATLLLCLPGLGMLLLVKEGK
jgi:hypothetical protein